MWIADEDGPNAIESRVQNFCGFGNCRTCCPPPSTTNVAIPKKPFMPSEENKVGPPVPDVVNSVFNSMAGKNRQGHRGWTCMLPKFLPNHATESSQQTVLHYGWIPLIIYVGFTRSNPQPSLIKYAFLLLFFSLATG